MAKVVVQERLLGFLLSRQERIKKLKRFSTYILRQNAMGQEPIGCHFDLHLGRNKPFRRELEFGVGMNVIHKKTSGLLMRISD